MIDFHAMAASTAAFVQQHQALTPLVVFALAFGESLAVVSLFFPATVLMLAIGGVMEAAGIHFWPVWAAAAAGAVLGDSVSYWIGFRYKDEARQLWPLSRRPDLVARGEAFFHRFGVWSIALGRFFGPVRAVVPLIAGILAMRQLPFQVANVASALVWAFALLAPGAVLIKGLGW